MDGFLLSFFLGLPIERFWNDLEIFTELCQESEMVRSTCMYCFIVFWSFAHLHKFIVF